VNSAASSSCASECGMSEVVDGYGGRIQLPWV